TGGRVVTLGRTGRNFAAGMSGGAAYVLDVDGRFAERCNHGMVDLDALEEIDDALVRAMIERHVELTSSELGARIVADWWSVCDRFVKVMPRDFKRGVG